MTRAPAQLLSTIERKLSYIDHHVLQVDSRSLKASQYDPITDTYTKKALSERSTPVGDTLMQRDLFSSFLIKNTTADLHAVDRQRCLNELPLFQFHHDAAIVVAKCQDSKTLAWYIRDFA